MVFVFFWKNYFLGRNFPVYAKSRIIPGNSSFTLRCIEIIAFILENNFISQHAESMCKTTWYKKLTVVFFCQFYCYMLSECWRTFSDVNCNIKLQLLLQRGLVCFVQKVVFGSVIRVKHHNLIYSHCLVQSVRYVPAHWKSLSEKDSKKYPLSSLNRRGSMMTTPSIAVLITFIFRIIVF